MKDGMVVEMGTHDSLMKNKRKYYELIQSQYDLGTENKEVIEGKPQKK